MCVYATEENDKLKYVRETFENLARTVDWGKHRLFVINNSQYQPAIDFLSSSYWNGAFDENIGVRHLPENIGTARGINLALRERRTAEVCCKCDDDVAWDEYGWADKLEETININPQLGILGLKRDDVYGEMIEEGDLLYCKDIMGTCTALSPLLLDKVGYYVQNGVYGFDDVLMSARSLAAGFKNAFLKDVRVTHLDEGGTEYTEWKKREAGIYLGEVSMMCEMYLNGKLDYYYGGGF